MTTRKFLVPALLMAGFFVAGCASGPRPADGGDRENFEYITSVEGMKKDDIYNGVELWIAENFKSAKQVIDYQNRDQGTIIGNGIIPGIKLQSGLILLVQDASFKMKIEARDEKIRLSFSQFQIVEWNNSTLYKEQAVQIKERLARFGDEIARALKNPKSKVF